MITWDPFTRKGRIGARLLSVARDTVRDEICRLGWSVLVSPGGRYHQLKE